MCCAYSQADHRGEASSRRTDRLAKEQLATSAAFRATSAQAFAGVTAATAAGACEAIWIRIYMHLNLHAAAGDATACCADVCAKGLMQRCYVDVRLPAST